MSKNPKPFNNPFGDLKLPSSTVSSDATTPSKKKGSKKPSKPAQPVVSKEKAPTQKDTLDVYDRKLFLDAVGGATPMQDRERRAPPESFEFQPTTERSRLEDSMALDELRALVGKEVTWHFHREDEHVEGRIESVSGQVLRSL